MPSTNKLKSWLVLDQSEICKPKIRKRAQVGDWIIGFRSRRPGDVLYAMQVTEKITFADYWRDERFADRKPRASALPDNIYRPQAGGGLTQVRNAVHGPIEAHKDISGQYVLLSTRFWYFGDQSVPIPTDLVHLVHTTQGHSVRIGRRPRDIEWIEQWLASWPPGIHGKPANASTKSKEAGLAQHQARCSQQPCSPPQDDKRSQRRLTCVAHSEARPAGSREPQRIVLSRKGFDATYGGMPSPILPDGRLVPLPIPSSTDAATMKDLPCASDIDPAGLLVDLSGGIHSGSTRVHLDPDLRCSARRTKDWRPAFGQTGAAQSHLATQQVGVGDVFLFFGWFRQVDRYEGRWRFVPRAPHLHVFFGWLEVGDVAPIVRNRSQSLKQYPWLAAHPHAANPSQYTDERNTIYVAAASSSFAPRGAGGGLFERFAQELCLTAPNATRSVWKLPSWFQPREGITPLTYHADAARWTSQGASCVLRSVAKGQEFVLRTTDYPESLKWVRRIVEVGLGSSDAPRRQQRVSATSRKAAAS